MHKTGQFQCLLISNNKLLCISELKNRKRTFKLEEKFEKEMYKVEQLKSFVDCQQCNKLLVDPVVMACGKLICKIHLEKLLTHEYSKKNM